MWTNLVYGIVLKCNASVSVTDKNSLSLYYKSWSPLSSMLNKCCESKFNTYSLWLTDFATAVYREINTLGNCSSDTDVSAGHGHV